MPKSKQKSTPAPTTTPPHDLAVILAGAGEGKRMGELGPKLLIEVGGKPALQRVAETFLAHPAVGEIVVTVPSELTADALRTLALAPNPRNIRLRAIEGGETRQESVALALAALTANLPYIAVHDVARVLIDAPLITKTLEAARATGAAIPALPIADSIKEVTPGPCPGPSNATIARSVPRQNLVGAQTPQIFASDILRKAHAHAREAGAAATDEAGLVEAMGVPVTVVPGDERNRKLTVPSDLVILNALLRAGAATERS
ncbi:MAG TPA: 2-C-methyl-D-erythritol 4-phosphate cytidylyltransferase [Candidatus Eisenbacteria bacterium]|nr:2-C-methyl-D-erythritol 4-phosphate cytidylyltransferase [Candidatus Eisenbacteria bacterium]